MSSMSFRQPDRNADSSSESDEEPWSEDEASSKIPPSNVSTTHPNDPKPAENGGTKDGAKGIWKEVMEEDVLTQDIMSSCGMKRKASNSRGVESYELPNRGPNEFRPSYRATRRPTYRRGGGRGQRKPMSGNIVPQDIIPSRPMVFDFNEADPDDIVAKGIAKLLSEPKIELIGRIVKFLGKAKAMDLLCKTMEVEQMGGILTKDRSRKRTRGGIYLHLLNQDPDLGKGLKGKIFEMERNEAREQDKMFKKRKANKHRRNHAKKMKMDTRDAADLPALPTRLELIESAAQQNKGKEDDDVLDLEDGEIPSD